MFCFKSCILSNTKRFVLLFSLFTFLSVQAENKSKFHVSLELSSKYMWRGLEYGEAPVAFPSIYFNDKGFNAFVMGAYAFDGSHQEVDYGVSYTKGWVTLGLSDYFFPSAVGEKDNYFDYASHSTGHSVESYLTIAPTKVPMWLTFSTYLFGADKKLNGNQAYSSYVELGYRYDINENNALSLGMGANLNKSFYTNYEKGFNVVNIALKYAVNVPIGKSFKLPVSVSYVLNPYKEKSFFTFSMYFNY